MFWVTFDIEENRLYYTAIGPLELWLKRAHNDWYIASKQEADFDAHRPLGCVESDECPQDLVWTRWVFSDDLHKLSVLPVMPDKPMIIKPVIQTKIPAGNTATIYINIPVWMRLSLTEKKDVSICDMPIHTLARSWYGNTVSGVSCYTRKSNIRKKRDDLNVSWGTALCSVQIENRSQQDLDLVRFRLNVENLSVFISDEQLCTNHVDVLFHGDTHESKAVISQAPSDTSKQYSLISGPRVQPVKNLIQTGFLMVKSFTGM